MVRGVVELPNGTGRAQRVAVFARDEKAEEAKTAGADVVGAEDLVETCWDTNLAEACWDKALGLGKTVWDEAVVVFHFLGIRWENGYFMDQKH